VRKKTNDKRSRAVSYSIVLTVMLGAALLVVTHIEKSQKERQDQQIIASYDQDAIDGKVPMPVKPDAVRVLRKEPGAPPTMVEVIIRLGETNRFQLISPDGNSATNWHFIKQI